MKVRQSQGKRVESDRCSEIWKRGEKLGAKRDSVAQWGEKGIDLPEQ